MSFFLKDKKGISITGVFQKLLDKLNRKPNKIRVDKGSGNCNKSMKSQLKDSDIELCSTYNEGKSIVAESFIRTLYVYINIFAQGHPPNWSKDVFVIKKS